MPDGKCIQNQISSNIKTDKKTNPSINSIVKQFKRRLPKDELVYTLLAALAATSEDASICAENGVVVIRVNGDNCLVNLPRPITKEQMDIIVNVVGEELRNKNFYLNLENEAYYEHRGEYMNTDSLDVVDVFRFIRDKGLYVEPYTFQSVPESEQTL